MSKEKKIIVVSVLLLALLIVCFLVWKLGLIENKEKIIENEKIPGAASSSGIFGLQRNDSKILSEREKFEKERVERILEEAAIARGNLLKDRQKLVNLASKIFSGNIVFEKTKNNPYKFGESFIISNNPAFEFNFDVYKYKKGMSSLKQGYEGLEWSINFDEELKVFRSLKPGIQSAMVWGSLGNEVAEVELRAIGKRNFAIYETYFKPSGWKFKNYMTFDEKNSQFVYISFSYGFYNFESEEDFAGEIDYFTKELEKILEAI